MSKPIARHPLGADLVRASAAHEACAASSCQSATPRRTQWPGAHGGIDGLPQRVHLEFGTSVARLSPGFSAHNDAIALGMKKRLSNPGPRSLGAAANPYPSRRAPDRTAPGRPRWEHREYGGGTVPYAHNFLANKDDPETQRWLELQKRILENTLDWEKVDDLADDWAEGADPDSGVSTIEAVGDRYVLADAKGLWSWKPEDSERHLIWPVEQLGEPSASIMEMAVSPDGRHAALAIGNADEMMVLRVLDIETGKLLDSEVQRAWTAKPHWLDDRTLLVGQLPLSSVEGPPTMRWRHQHVCALRIEGNQVSERIVFDARPYTDRAHGHWTIGSNERHVYAIGSDSNDYDKMVFVKPRGKLYDDDPWQPVLPDYEISNCVAGGKYLFLVSYRDRAGGEVIRFDPQTNEVETMRTPFDHTPIVPDQSSLAIDDSMVYVKKSGGNHDRLFGIGVETGESVAVELPFNGEITLMSANAQRPGLSFRLNGYRGESGHFRFDPLTREVTETGLMERFEAIPGIDVVLDTAPGADGQPVAYVVVERKSSEGSAAIVSAYGAYGFPPYPRMPSRSELHALVVKRDVKLVYAYIRGGSSGLPWAPTRFWRAPEWGPLQRKSRALGDLSGVIRRLGGRYIHPDRITIRAASAGGQPAGIAIVEDAMSIAGAFIQMGVLDPTRKEDDTNGPFNVPEHGTRETREGLEALQAMSPYHRVLDLLATDKPVRPVLGRGRPIAPMVVLGGANDTRVPPGPMRAFVAASSDVAAKYAEDWNEPPVPIVYIETDGGHREVVQSGDQAKRDGVITAIAFLLQAVEWNVERTKRNRGLR